MTDSALHLCKLPECGVATTGKCIEGLELSVCPNYVGETADSAEMEIVQESIQEIAEPTGSPVEMGMVDLPDGLDFDLVTGSQITRARLTRVIVIAGDKDSGKTTLVTSIFDLFQTGPFAGYLFSGCRTFPGVERRCFPSRVASDQAHPDTTRTPRSDGQRLLHLKARVEDLSRPAQDVMFSDVSGEFFKDACNSTDECLQLQILNRADHVALCLDGKKLASAALRHEAFNTGVLFLQSALDAGMVGPKTFVDVLILKRDLLEPAEGSSSTLDYVQGIRERMANQFKDRFGRLRFFEVAARPSTSKFPYGYGLEEILPSWIEDTPFYSKPHQIDMRGLSSLAQTEFDRYALRGLT